MGYLIVSAVLVVGVPLLLLMLGHRPRGAGTLGGRRGSGGVGPDEPSSDQPTPEAKSVNQMAAGAERRLPPG